MIFSSPVYFQQTLSRFQILRHLILIISHSIILLPLPRCRTLGLKQLHVQSPITITEVFNKSVGGPDTCKTKTSATQ